MTKTTCAQCGAPLHGGETCAERLYRMLTSGGIAESRLGEALAQFALSHPMTYSPEALRVASDLLDPQRPPVYDDQDCQSVESPDPRSRWWRHCARRVSCH